jgi:hypothetical protein
VTNSSSTTLKVILDTDYSSYNIGEKKFNDNDDYVDFGKKGLKGLNKA